MSHQVGKDKQPPPKHSLKPKEQRKALEQLLETLYGKVEKEKSFAWLVGTRSKNDARRSIERYPHKAESSQGSF